MTNAGREPGRERGARRVRPVRGAPPPGHGALVMLGLSMGVLLMSVQLWLLTLAFNLYLLGERRGTLLAALVSGAVFVGGLAMLWILRRQARARRPEP